jgi:uncharacterized membrane protein HdeD (DUF308 family)
MRVEKEGVMDPFTVLLIRGVVGIVAGIVAFLWPGLTITALVVLFGAYAFIDGVTNLISGLRDTPGRGRSWAVFFQGVVGVAAGVLTFLFPPAAALVLVFWIGAWALITGVLEIVAAVKLRKEIKGEWLLALSGILSIVFGAALFAFPAMGIVAIAWILGTYAVVSGMVLVALAIRMRLAARHVFAA